ncbi:hypothetical protein [Stakelama tenebrarum]|uniref:TIGR02301 family protein n=1 Tax=Stakelama tenebrarum TaxID=2711215 RepID=A0A6G6Y325_9SPHN|nr:hypothetical protein [Sphingosinithalassobacter tenebrarum]QIG79118.1 hypothetical protein G5C33_04495 [Sphingosinithalassobacter tenebrarum]
MSVRRFLLAVGLALGLFGAAPASAQFFFRSADLSGARVTGAEPGIVGSDLPGATAEELRAALVWNLRSALNVAALQCYFEPTLLTHENYAALLRDHERELAESYETLRRYFIRVAPSRRAGQTEFDRFGTRVYSGFSTVSAQLSFCQTAASIGHQAVFTEKGQLGDLAQERMRELRNSLIPVGDQAFTPERINPSIGLPPFPPFAEERCWRRHRTYRWDRCGPF